MLWTGHPYMLCEEVTDAVRQVFPLARRKGVGIFFDYEGIAPVGRDDTRMLRSLVERLLSAAVAATESGDSIFCFVHVEPSKDDEARVRIRLLHSGRVVPPDDLMLLQQAVEAGQPRHPVAASLKVVRTLCGSMGGDFAYKQEGSAGAAVNVSVPVPCFAPLGASLDLKVDGAQAWLIGERLRHHELLVRRLQRLGFAVRVFAHAADVERSLRRPGEGHAPALMVGSEQDGVSLEQMAALRRASSTRPPLMFLCVNAAWDPARARQVEGINVQVMPFSPRQLAHITHMAGLIGSRPPSETQAMPLGFSSRPRGLVVAQGSIVGDLAASMLHALGYEVDMAASVAEALGEGATFPEIVLIDGAALAHDEAAGIATGLKRAKRRRTLPPLRVLLMNVTGSPEQRLAWFGADIDGVISKPLRLDSLISELSDAG